jgi:hypothetical protein
MRISFTSSLSPSNKYQIVLVSVDHQTLASFASSFGINPLPIVYLSYTGRMKTAIFADRLVMFPETNAFNNSAPSHFLENCALSGDLLSLTCNLPESASNVWWLFYVLTFSPLHMGPDLNGLQLQYLLQAPLIASSGVPWTLTFGQLPSLDTTSVRTFMPSNATGLRIMPNNWTPSDKSALDVPIQPINGITYIPTLTSQYLREDLFFAGTTLSALANVSLGYTFNSVDIPFMVFSSHLIFDISFLVHNQTRLDEFDRIFITNEYCAQRTHIPFLVGCENSLAS